MSDLLKDIKKRYFIFIVITFIISILTWYHISCFNNIYPHMKKEWLIFSILIIICVQILSLLASQSPIPNPHMNSCNYKLKYLLFLEYKFKSKNK